MATNAYIAHEDGTPFTETELDNFLTGCPDCDVLSAPELARRVERDAAVRAERDARRGQPIFVLSYEEIPAMQDSKSIFAPKHEVVVRKRPDSVQHSPKADAVCIDTIPVRCPKHVLRKHPWIAAIKLEDLDDQILHNFAQFCVDGKVWVPALAGPCYFPKGFCYEGREWSQDEVHAEIERRKGKPARVENAMQKYLRLSRVPSHWITDAERRFLQSREAALVSLKLRMR
jgi:hypothetical protein